MAHDESDLKGVGELGRIFAAFSDKKLLCDFFITSSLAFVKADEGYLFLLGNQEKLWLEATSLIEKDDSVRILQDTAETVLHKGQPIKEPQKIYIPLVVQNAPMGVAAFILHQGSFEDRDFTLSMDLSSQLAGALKNIILMEKTIKMERLAAVGQTTSVVMHELNNILQLAKLSDECLRRGLEKSNPKSLQRGLDGIAKALKDMEGFAYEMLSLTKDYKIKPAPMDLKDLLEELQADLYERASQANVKIDFKVEGELSGVYGEPRSLYRALLNMVKNAIEAADKDDAWIQIRAKAIHEDSYEITVKDNGHGMSEEIRAQIFQTFFTTKGEKGTGLGLMIIDKTIKAHQGQIRLESEQGKGSCFTLTFPKKPSEI